MPTRRIELTADLDLHVEYAGALRVQLAYRRGEEPAYRAEEWLYLVRLQCWKV